MGETLYERPMQVGMGDQSALNLSAATLVKAGPGRVARVSVLEAGSDGALHDAATVGGASNANRIAIVPATVGVIELDWPFVNGLVYVPGASQVASVSYS